MSNVRKLLVVHPPREVDIATAAGFAAHLARAVSEGVDVLVIDCADVTFMDSAGIDAIRSAGHDLEARGGRVTVRNAAGHIRLMLDLADGAG